MKKSNLADGGIKAGALTLAVLLWFHAVTEHPYEKKIDIRLKVQDPPSDPSSEKTIVANLLPDQVKVLVSGQGKDLLRLNSNDVLLRVKPEGNPGSVHSYSLTPADIEDRIAELDVQVEEVLEPKKIEIVLDRWAERTVQVIPFVELEIAEAYTQVGAMSIEPGEVKISGPSTQIPEIESIRTYPLTRKNIQEDIEEKLWLSKPQDMRLEVDPPHVILKVDVQILVENDIVDVPVQIRHTRGINIIPEPAQVKVKVKGGVDIIANLDPEKDLDLYVDYRDYDGQSLLVLAAEDRLFEIREIVPSKVNLVEQ